MSLQPLTTEEASSVLPPIYERHLTTAVGSHARWPGWWQERHFFDPEDRRGGASAHRFVVVERNGEPVGYISFRHRRLPDSSEGRAELTELVALDDDAHRALWHFATNIDLYRNARWWNAPIDDPVIATADRFRSIEARRIDTIWIRLLDVAKALEQRRYERDGSIVLEVADPLTAGGADSDRSSRSTTTKGCGPAAGTYRLSVDGGVGTVARTDDQPDVMIGVAELGRLYLGGGSAVVLQRAGLLSAAPDDAVRLDGLFRTARQPHCIEVF